MSGDAKRGWREDDICLLRPGRVDSPKSTCGRLRPVGKMKSAMKWTTCQGCILTHLDERLARIEGALSLFGPVMPVPPPTTVIHENPKGHT